MNIFKKIFNRPQSQENARINLDQKDGSKEGSQVEPREEQKLQKEPTMMNANKKNKSEEKAGRQIPDITTKKQKLSKKLFKILQIPLLLLLMIFFGAQSFKNIRQTGILPQNVSEKFTKIKNKILQFEEIVEEKIHDVAAKIPSIHQNDFALDYQELLQKLDNYNTASLYFAQKLDKYKYNRQDFGEDKMFDDIQHLVGKVSHLPRVEEKIKTIFELNQTLAKQYEETSKIQSRVEKIRGKFHKKVDDIQVLRQEILDALNGVQAFSEEIRALKKEKVSLKGQYQEAKYKLEQGQMDYQYFISQFEDLVQQESIHLKSPLSSLEAEIEQKNTFIQALYDENLSLEAEIAVSQERIQKLYDLLDENMNALNKPILTSNPLVEHVKSSINQFRNIANELANIKTQSLKNAQGSIKGSIEQLLRMQFTELPKVISDDSLIEKLEDKIQKEKLTLKRWAAQQFTTLEFSMKEIRKNADRLKHLEGQLHQVPETSNVLSKEKRDYENFVHILPKQIENLSKKIAEAKEKIDQNNLSLKNAKEWILERQKLQAAALQLHISTSDLENIFKIKDEELGVFQEDVMSKEKELREKEKISQDYQKQTKNSAKQLVSRINKRISDPPQPDELEEELRIFQAHLKEAQNTVDSIRKIFDEIKNLLL